MSKISFILITIFCLCLCNHSAFAGDENICHNPRSLDDMADRFISGQISALNLTRPYVAQNFPGLYRFATKYEKNCSWGWYFKVRQDNVLGGMEYTTGFVLRF